jgi:diguanylate cyclase (GGDEF)-like protein
MVEVTPEQSIPDKIKNYTVIKKAPKPLARDLVARDLLIDVLNNRVRKYKELALIDEATGLLSRRAIMGDKKSKPPFIGELSRLYELSARYNHNLSLLIIDFDYLKTYNDAFGHDAGDKGLVNLARIMQSSLIRRTDIAARYGGDELLVLLPETGYRAALKVAERIRKKVEQSRGFRRKSTVSIGVATFPFGKIHSSESLFKAADQALYKAKENGRNRVISWNDLVRVNQIKTPQGNIK